jgi:membrane protease YdiL (CAAX protease family)
VTPLFFASCHLHHARELARAHGLGPALCTVGLQFAYTTLAGWGFTFVLMASGSVLAAALAHGCCNVMGLPPFHRMGTVARAASVAGVVAAVGWVAPWLAHQSSGSAYAWT